MILRLLGGLIGSLLAGAIVGEVLPIIYRLPNDMSAADTQPGLLLGPPLMAVSFYVGYLLMGNLAARRANTRKL